MADMIQMVKDGEVREFPDAAREYLEIYGWRETEPLPEPIKMVTLQDVPEEVAALMRKRNQIAEEEPQEETLKVPTKTTVTREPTKKR